MIDKILDRYYAKKLIRRVESHLNFRWGPKLEFEVKVVKDRIIINAKPYRNKNYTHIENVSINEALFANVEFKQLMNRINDYIKSVDENDDWK